MCLLPAIIDFFSKRFTKFWKQVFSAILNIIIFVVNCTFTVSSKTTVCQGPNNAPNKNSHRRPRDIPQSVSANMISILISCSKKSTKLLDFTLKALKLLRNLITSKEEVPRALWFAASTR